VTRSQDNSVVKHRVMGWIIRAFESQQGLGISFSPPCPDQLWGPHSLPFSGNLGPFPGGKVVRA